MQGFLHPEVNVVMQKRDVKKAPTSDDPRFLYYTISPRYGKAYIVKDVAVFDNKIPFDGGVPATSVCGFNDLQAHKWVRFHILNQYLGGPGDNTGNLIPTRQSDNKSTYWSNIETDMKAIASNSPGLAFNATVNYHANSVYPSQLTGSYGPIGGGLKSINMTFDEPQEEDFNQSLQRLRMVNFLAQYEKRERDKILKRLKQIGYIMPSAEDYAKERMLRTLSLRQQFRPDRYIQSQP